jgi:hypothetical protein
MPDADTPICPMCGGAPGDGGALGARYWYRCRQCGWEWTVAMDDAETSEKGATMVRFMYNGLKTEDGVLHKAWYSIGRLTNAPEGTITIYARTYRALPKVEGLVVENNTEIQSDYFETDTIRVTPDNPHYPAVLTAYQKQQAHSAKTRGIYHPRSSHKTDLEKKR